MIVGLVGPCNPWRLRGHLAPSAEKPVPTAEPGVPVELLADALIGAGHRVIIYTLDEHCLDPVRLSGPNLVIRIGPYRPRHRMRDYFAAERRQLEQAIRAEPPDILHVHWGYEHALAAAAANVAPIVMTLHDWAPAILRWQPTLYRLGRLVMYLHALGVIRFVAAPSPYLAGKLKRWFRRECDVVPPGVPLDHIVSQPRTFPGGAPLLVSANQGFSRFKNVRTLLRAFVVIRAAFPLARLRLLGHGHEPGGAAEHWAAAQGLCGGVVFIGQVPAAEVSRHFAEAHLMVHPSLEEAFGHVLTEAMSAGTPVVAAAEAVAPSWILGQGRNGVLARCRSPGPLAQACIDLLSDPLRWEAVGRAGWEAVTRDFSTLRMTSGYLALYRRCLAQSGQGVTDDQP